MSVIQLPAVDVLRVGPFGNAYAVARRSIGVFHRLSSWPSDLFLSFSELMNLLVGSEVSLVDSSSVDSESWVRNIRRSVSQIPLEDLWSRQAGASQ